MAYLYRGCDHLKRLQEAMGIKGRVKSIVLELDIKGVATAEVVRYVEEPGMDELIEELSRYRLVPLEPEDT